jgi:hypothetical protein
MQSPVRSEHDREPFLHPARCAVLSSQSYTTPSNFCSNLHANILQQCNEAGIEILSPTYTALRDGNASTIPAEKLPPDYIPPGFRISAVNHNPPS